MIDANILPDVLQNRPEYVKHSSVVWKLCETNQTEGYVSALTVSNLVYIMRKEMDPAKIEETLKELSLIFRFTEFSVNDLVKAAELKWDDFEDAIQSAAALRLHADYIITRNVRDLRRAKFRHSHLLNSLQDYDRNQTGEP